MSSNVKYDSIHSLVALERCCFPSSWCFFFVFGDVVFVFFLANWNGKYMKQENNKSQKSHYHVHHTQCDSYGEATTGKLSTNDSHKITWKTNKNLQIFELYETSKRVFVHIRNLISFKISVLCGEFFYNVGETTARWQNRRENLR